MLVSAVRPVHDVFVGLSRSYLFEDLTPDELRPLAASATTRALVRGERLCHLGDPADEIWVVLSGEVKDSAVDAEGYEVIHFVHGPGMTLGEPGFFAVERTRIVEVIAVVPSTIIRLDRRDLTPFMARHPSVKDRVLETLASNSRWQTTVISSAARRTLTDRLILRLLELAEPSPQSSSGEAITPKISQSTLAAMIGVSRENVNRALAALAVEGAIRQPGASWADLDAATATHGLATTGGLISTTGVGGLTLGGGIGWLQRKYGLSCDNLVGADVVTADGDVVPVSATERPALLWGLRGGGGNFGIVSRFEFSLHQVSIILGGLLLFPIERGREVLTAIRDWAADAPDDASMLAAVITAPPEPFVPQELVGQKAVAILGCWCGDLDEGTAAIEPLRALVGTPATPTTSSRRGPSRRRTCGTSRSIASWQPRLHRCRAMAHT